MAKNKKLADLISHTSVLPYASEMFGIYQPLLGWKSKRIEARFGAGLARDKKALLHQLQSQFSGVAQVHYGQGCELQIDVYPGTLNTGHVRLHDSLIMEKIAEQLPPVDSLIPEMWIRIINREQVEGLLRTVVIPEYSRLYHQRCQENANNNLVQVRARTFERAAQRDPFVAAFESQLRYESSIAGALLFLVEQRNFVDLSRLFYSGKNKEQLAATISTLLSALTGVEGPLDLSTMNPRDKEHLKRVALSPISVVHLFRQYFFELDTFLGSPVSHVWLSPSSTVELIEVQTRKTIIEKSLESSTESTTKAESEIRDEDEISDAVKEDNKQDIKFGASVTASYAGITATSSFDYGTSQQLAREETHKRMRQQTEKLSTEIRKNYRSTFKTITETTDTSSKRYVLQNGTDELINYELRRKMRQVAVQVQDIGSYLCWQTYVDRPGESLGVAKLVHMAKPPELDGLHAPDEIPMLQPFSESKVVTIPFVSIEDTDADNEGEVYSHGVEVDDSETLGELEKIQSDFAIECVCPKSGYVLTNIEFDGQGKPVTASRKNDIVNTPGKASFTLHLDSADFQGQNSIQVKLALQWSPADGANDEAIKKNRENVEAFKAREAQEYQKAFIETARDRVRLGHQIKARPSEDLREEERIVVYRKLIQDMLTSGIPMPDDRTRHVVAELISSIFDIDKMLYFVAPEWWRPQLRTYAQQLEETPPSSARSPRDPLWGWKLVGKEWMLGPRKSENKLATSTVGWGGVDDSLRDNYYITEDSEPAKFGSSLGWLLQLDGDNMRNAFLNAPWVKAVIPIRPGKEEAAINWLKGVEGFNGISEGDIYQTDNPDEKDIDGNPLNGQSMMDVILDLARKIKKKHEEGIASGQYPKPSEVADPTLVDADNVVTTTPIDRVYEHGFYPLKGGFRANVADNYEVFDQWLEILPTDQIVPVEVKYDPKTGRQL